MYVPRIKGWPLLDALTMISLTGWCVKKAPSPSPPQRNVGPKPPAEWCAKKAPAGNLASGCDHINFESLGAGGFFHAPTGLDNNRFAIVCNIWLGLRMFPYLHIVPYIGGQFHQSHHKQGSTLRCTIRQFVSSTSCCHHSDMYDCCHF